MSDPGEAEPGEILTDRGDEMGPAAPGIDVLDPQQESPAAAPRGIGREQRSERVAAMQQAGRGRGEARDHGHGPRR
jgi:hypothetical protein